jgi:hypothetical protein
MLLPAAVLRFAPPYPTPNVWSLILALADLTAHRPQQAIAHRSSLCIPSPKKESHLKVSSFGFSGTDAKSYRSPSYTENFPDDKDWAWPGHTV